MGLDMKAVTGYMLEELLAQAASVEDLRSQYDTARSVMHRTIGGMSGDDRRAMRSAAKVLSGALESYYRTRQGE